MEQTLDAMKPQNLPKDPVDTSREAHAYLPLFLPMSLVFGSALHFSNSRQKRVLVFWGVI